MPPEPKTPIPLETPTLDKLREMPPGLQRDLYFQINQRAIQMETRRIQDIEAAANVSARESRIRLAERLQLDKLVTWLSKDPTSANIYRSIHNADINRQLAELEALEAAGGGRPASESSAPSNLRVLTAPTDSEPPPQAA